MPTVEEDSQQVTVESEIDIQQPGPLLDTYKTEIAALLERARELMRQHGMQYIMATQLDKQEKTDKPDNPSWTVVSALHIDGNDCSWLLFDLAMCFQEGGREEHVVMPVIAVDMPEEVKDALLKRLGMNRPDMDVDGPLSRKPRTDRTPGGDRPKRPPRTTQD